ncbi:uncharacterized protein LOC129763377 isoform X2 [Toxorhynchites rutilus septentrionalis]|uniref:uncharacterized protein LOC129763377 isoform X2 n=1 Tax=Toxorhynchites rutilus septentrionalis TaxID=329112 RepID=UPI00247992B1|nr:uncharacterized protein LOC129763377 isoform X2 [Toxorhynchites rutilus septentrionalis]
MMERKKKHHKKKNGKGGQGGQGGVGGSAATNNGNKHHHQQQQQQQQQHQNVINSNNNNGDNRNRGGNKAATPTTMATISSNGSNKSSLPLPPTETSSSGNNGDGNGGVVLIKYETKSYPAADSSCWDNGSSLQFDPPHSGGSVGTDRTIPTAKQCSKNNHNLQQQQHHHQRQLSASDAEFRAQLIPYTAERSTKLDYKPSTRTVSSEDSCYSEERYISSDEDEEDDEDDEEDEIDLDESDIREEYLRKHRHHHHQHHNRNNKQRGQPKESLKPKEAPTAAESATVAPSTLEIPVGEQPQGERRRSISQLQNTLNKAKYHLSFDKWKNHHGGGNSGAVALNGNHLVINTGNNNNSRTSCVSLPSPAAGGGVGGNVQLIADFVNNNRNSMHAYTMPSTTSAASSPAPSVGMSPSSMATPSPGSANSSPSISSEPFSRLSRWFSIRRGSMNQYDLKGSSNANTTPGTISAGGKENRRNSIDHVDSTGSLFGNKFDGAGKLAMGKVLEADEDPLQLALESFAMTRGTGTESKIAERRHIPVALPPAPPGLTQQQLKRRLIVAAIVHSENSYVASLQRLVNEYKRPLEESSPPILNPSKTAILFHRLPEILQLHTLFRISLAEYVQSWDAEEKIGDVFVATFSKSLVLDVYSGFINNFSIAMDLARMEAKRKSALSDFFKVKQISSHDRLSFFGLMVKPVQRFPQFILFLQDLLKYTPQGHHDRMSLQLALTQLESLAEMLNERKREAEQFQAFKEMLENISGTFNIRSLVSGGAADNAINSTNTRYLLREDNVTQLEFNQSGFIVKSKKRRLLLLNDKVLCVSVAPKQSHEFGSTEKLTFKWMHPVQDVEIVDNNQSITLSRILTAGMKRGNSLKSNSSFDASYMSPGGPTGFGTGISSTMSSSVGGGSTGGGTLPGSGSDANNLCSEMNNLMHDYEVMSRINDLVGTLKGNYKDINLGVTRSILADIQASIQKKDEEISWVDSCCLQLVLKNAAKGGKEDTTYTFQIENPAVKKDWITELRLAQLALDPNNSPAWQIGAEHEQQRYSLAKMPLFVKAYPAYKSQHQTEVCCGCYFSSNLSASGAYRLKPSARKRSKHANTLWICSSDKINSHITILSHNSAQHQSNGGFGELARFSLGETIVTCMEYVKEGGLMTGDDIGADSIWMGTNNHRVLVYSASYPINDEQLVNLSLPGVPSQILYFNERVFVGMTNGSVLVFRRTEGGIWNLNSPKILAVQNEPISSLLAINSSVYFAAGKHVYVINGRTNEVEKNFHIKHTNSANVSSSVNLLAHSGIGLWISLKNSSIICLYHTETFKHLQDINIASNVLRVTSSHQNPSRESNSSIQVTALMAAKGMLWVGTNVGITLTIPLPRLEGVPSISGGVNISYHAHLGPVTFLLPLVTRSYHSLPPAPAVKIIQDTTEGVKQQSAEQKVEKVDSQVDDEQTEKQREAIALKEQICSSPVILRRKKQPPMESGRMAKTLPRNLRTSSGAFSPSIHSTLSSSSQYSDQGCDVYGLYSDLIFVKEDIENQTDRNILDPSYDYLRRSDPDIAAIPAKVSTLDRRLRMKVSRPRSLDLSNWSMESRSSSLYTSSGSDENMGGRSGNGSKNVSRNSSSASHKMTNSDLDNINEHEVVPTAPTEPNPPTATNELPAPSTLLEVEKPPETAPAITTSKRKKTQSTSGANAGAGGDGASNGAASARKTVLTLMGGRGYVNWRHIWERAGPADGGGGGSGGIKSATSSPQNHQHHQRASSVTSLAGLGQTNSTDAHIIIWEKKL